MNLRIFQKFDPWSRSGHAFVWNKKPGETPPPAPAGAPEAEQPPAPADAAADARAQAHQAEQGAQLAEKARAGQPDHAAAEAVLAELGIEVKVAPKEGQPQLTVEKIEEALRQGSMEKLLALDVVLSTSVTEQEKEALQKKFDTNGILDWKKLTQALGQVELTVRELVVMSALLEENPEAMTEGADKTLLQQANERLKALKTALEKQLKPQYTAEQVDQLFRKPECREAYDQFIKDDNKAKFLAAIVPIVNEEEKKIIEWAITTPPTVFEMKAVAEKSKDLIAKKDQEAIVTAVVERKMNYREGMTAKAILDDLQRIAESQSNIPDSVKGLGFVAILEKLIDQLSKLAAKISGALERAFAKKDEPSEQPSFAKSPFGEDKKFKLKQSYEPGKGIAFEAPKDTQIFTVEPGKISVNGNVVTVTLRKGSRIEYRNITAEPGINGQTIEAGKPIGKVSQQGFVQLEAFDKEGGELDPELFLKPYLAPEETVVQKPAPPTGPVVPSPSATAKSAVTPQPSPQQPAPTKPS